MLDLRLRSAKDRACDPFGRRLAGRVPVGALTALSLVLSLAAGAAAWRQLPAVAVGCWLAGRFVDGIDGATARAAGTATDAGGYADLLLDTIGYAAVPLGIAFGADDLFTWQVVAVLLATFYVNSVAWLMLSALLEKHADGAAARGEQTSVTMPSGLIEGAETIVAFTIALAAPATAPTVFVVMSVGVMIGVGQRAVSARRLLGQRR